MRRKWGGDVKLGILITAILTVVGILAFDFSESTAEAGLLKNGVRPGDRSKMHIVRRPRAGTRKRIYAPGERQPNAKPRGQAKPRAAKQRYKQRHAWFWKVHSPAMGAAGPDRWQKTLATMRQRRAAGKGLLRTSDAQAIMAKYHVAVTKAAAINNISEGVLAAVIIVESSGKPKAVSPKGAQGLMQLIPATAKRFGVSDSFDPDQNILGGSTYLNWLMDEFERDPLLALAAYNAGENSIYKHKGVPPYAETRDYIVKVMDAIVALEEICPAATKGPRGRCPAAEATPEAETAEPARKRPVLSPTAQNQI